MSNSTETSVSLQWIKGDKIGSVEQISLHEGEWTIFSSGTRIATNLIGEFMIPIEGEPLDLNPVQPTLITPSPISASINVKRQPKDNPIKTLFDKQKKTDKVELKLTFSINVPTSDIFNIINMTFDEDEVRAELDSFISNQINEEVIKETLITSINELIEKRFKPIS
jgi:hypothetical protein